MPYIITTKERAPFAAGLSLDTFDVVSRRAVGTLDEAREITWENVVDAGAGTYPIIAGRSSVVEDLIAQEEDS